MLPAKRTTTTEFHRDDVVEPIRLQKPLDLAPGQGPHGDAAMQRHVAYISAGYDRRPRFQAASGAVNIGDLAAASGVSTKTIRYYERVGLIRRASRGDSGYRIYGDGDLNDLRFLHRARELGFSVSTMRELLSLWRNESRESADVKRMTLAHIHTLDRQISGLRAMKETLQRLADACDGDERPGCAIMDDLASGDTPRDRRQDEHLRKVT